MPVPGDMFDIDIPETEVPYKDNDRAGYFAHWVVLEVRQNGWCCCLPMDIAPAFLSGDLEIEDPFTGIGQSVQSTLHVLRWVGETMVYRRILGRMFYRGRLDPSVIVKLFVMQKRGEYPPPLHPFEDGVILDGLGLDMWEEEHLLSIRDEIIRIEEYQRRHNVPRAKAIVTQSVIDALDAGKLSEKDAAIVRFDLDIN